MSMSTEGNESQESLTQTTIKLFQTGFSLLTGLWELAVLEMRLASKSLISIVILGIALIFLTFILWIFLMAAGAAWLVSLHLSWIAAFLLVAVFHFLIIVVALLLLKRAKYHLTFPETRKQLGLLEEE